MGNPRSWYPPHPLLQLIANLSYLAIGPTNEAIGDIEDKQLEAAIRKHIGDLSDRAANVV